MCSRIMDSCHFICQIRLLFVPNCMQHTMCALIGAIRCCQSPGGAAEKSGAARKFAKYASLTPSHTFQPLALETLGPINSTGIFFFTEFSRRLSDVSGDCRETTYFIFQRGSLAVQRYNSVAFKETFTVSTKLD